jgi:hypothetical protein
LVARPSGFNSSSDQVLFLFPRLRRRPEPPPWHTHNVHRQARRLRAGLHAPRRLLERRRRLPPALGTRPGRDSSSTPIGTAPATNTWSSTIPNAPSAPRGYPKAWAPWRI